MKLLLHFQTKSDAVVVDDLNGGVITEILPELGNENIHASPEEVVVVAPHFLEDLFTFQHTVAMTTKQAQHIGFFLSERLVAARMLQHQVLLVEDVFSERDYRLFWDGATLEEHF